MRGFGTTFLAVIVFYILKQSVDVVWAALVGGAILGLGIYFGQRSAKGLSDTVLIRYKHLRKKGLSHSDTLVKITEQNIPEKSRPAFSEKLNLESDNESDTLTALICGLYDRQKPSASTEERNASHEKIRMAVERHFAP